MTCLCDSFLLKPHSSQHPNCIFFFSLPMNVSNGFLNAFCVQYFFLCGCFCASRGGLFNIAIN